MTLRVLHAQLGFAPGLITHLKTASARKPTKPFGEHIRKFYRESGFWHRAYYPGSAGDTSLETVRRYVEQQAGAA